MRNDRITIKKDAAGNDWPHPHHRGKPCLEAGDSPSTRPARCRDNPQWRNSDTKYGISWMETRETTQWDNEYEIEYLEHYIAYQKGKEESRTHKKV